MNITYSYNTSNFTKSEAALKVNENRQKILNLESSLLRAIKDGELEDASSEWTLKHTFAPGTYARTLIVPKGCIAIGKIHKHAHLNFIMRGIVSVMTPDGGLEEFHAPYMFVSQPGTKRAVYAHEEVEWTTVHVTEETDVEKIEEQVIAKSFTEYDLLLGNSSNQLIETDTEGDS